MNDTQLVVRDARQAIQQIESQNMALDAVGRKAAIDDLLNKVALVQEVMTKVMHDGEHYGKIPGCGDKPALLKAGAEKLGMTFRLKAQFDVAERDLGRAHREYSVRCSLSDGNMGVGSCSTMESKYRYRSAERKCPKCGKPAIIPGKAEFGGGWLCWNKKGGCGEKFKSDDQSIVNQPMDKVEHDNPADYYNTCLKMAKKRAHVDAIITATACSDIFTQDVEEMVQNAESNPSATTPSAPAQRIEHPRNQATSPKPAAAPDDEQVFPVCEVLMVAKKPGSKQRTDRQGNPMVDANGQPVMRHWTTYFIKVNDGVGEFEVLTFDDKLGELAIEADTEQSKVRLVTKPGKKPGSREIVSLERAGNSPAQPQEDLPMQFDEHGNPLPEVVP